MDIIVECNNEIYRQSLHRINHHHLLPAIDEGIVIINDRTAKVQVDIGSEIWVHGTHLLTFDPHAVFTPSERGPKQSTGGSKMFSSERHLPPKRAKSQVPSSP
ncbi:uncharacterized protein LOC116801510 [Drosophila sechellia]|uniref:uncharacterized protein LOC116801510 n=1 Tax=Drosophila sechellia TaxID=7238 RepID=UPI0013DE132D|nr:uncharacterized protein LOC116801510 [Drosophila sechellia]